MKKTFKLDELDCANCGAKMEDAIKKIEGVVSAKVNFMAQKLTIEASDERFDAIMDEAQKMAKPHCCCVMPVRCCFRVLRACAS